MHRVLLVFVAAMSALFAPLWAQATPVFTVESGNIEVIGSAGPEQPSPETVNKVARAIGRGEPQRRARRAARQGEFRFFEIYYHGGRKILGVDCTISPAQEFVDGYELGDMRGGERLENLVALWETYAALYNRSLVESKNYPYADICYSSLAHEPMRIVGEWPIRGRINKTTKDTGLGSLPAAARLNDIYALERLIKSGAALDEADYWEMTPLGWATAREHTKIVEMLLHHGANSEAPSGVEERTPLWWAARGGDIKIGRLLLEAGANPNRGSGYRMDTDRPLNVAAKNGDLEFVKLLLDNGGGLNLFGGSMTPLMQAAKNNKLKMVDYLLANGAASTPIGSGEFDGPYSGLTALNQAVLSGNPDIIRSILAAGADIDQTNIYGGFSALHSSVEERDLYLTQLLLAAGADPNVGQKARESGGERILSNSPLHTTTRNGDYEATRMLLAAGADIDAIGEWERTPLLGVIGFSAGADMLVFLIDQGANVDVVDYKGNSPIHEILLRMSPQSVRKPLIDLLLKKGTDVRRANDDGDTVLHKACSPGNVELFLQYGADIEAKNNDGLTPLLSNLSWYCEAGALALLEAGADRAVTNAEGKSAIEIAREKKLQRVLEVLER